MEPGTARKVMLFDGTSLEGWTTLDGGPAAWTLEDGVMTVGDGDIISREEFADAHLHVEFRVPDMPEATGQGKGNSGVYIHNRYEIQVLDSFGHAVPGTGDCGAVYKMYAPLVNACKPPEEWQTYDIFFRAPRLEDDEVVEKARLTVIQNGMVVQNNVILHSPTGSRSKKPIPGSGPLLLQDHGDPVSFRNVWIKHLPSEGSDSYEPR